LISAIVIPLGLLTFGFGSLSCYLTFAQMLPPNLAALVTAACSVILIAAVFLIAKLSNWSHNRPVHPRRMSFDSEQRRVKSTINQIEDILGKQADPGLLRWVRDNPDRATLLALAIGAATGYSPKLRAAILEACKTSAGNPQHH